MSDQLQLAQDERSSDSSDRLVAKRRRRLSRRRGFTCVELVTCASVVIVMMSLCMPAVLMAWQQSRSDVCKNNLKRLGLALHNYHDVYRMFPPGWVTREVKGLQTQGFGWQTGLLPYIDQGNVSNLLSPDGGGFDEMDEARMQAAKTRIRTFRCPSDTTPEFNPFREEWPTSNYSGNYGHLAIPRWLPAQASKNWPGQVAPWFGPRSAPRNRGNAAAIDKFGDPRPTGLFSQNTCIRIQDCVDGTSNTILVGERCVTSAAGIWLGVTAGTNENDALTDCSHASRPNAGLSSFSSLHGVVHVSLCDGSARGLNPSVDSLPNSDPEKPLGVYQKLAARNDGQIIEF